MAGDVGVRFCWRSFPLPVGVLFVVVGGVLVRDAVVVADVVDGREDVCGLDEGRCVFLLGVAE